MWSVTKLTIQKRLYSKIYGKILIRFIWNHLESMREDINLETRMGTVEVGCVLRSQKMDDWWRTVYPSMKLPPGTNISRKTSTFKDVMVEFAIAMTEMDAMQQHPSICASFHIYLHLFSLFFNMIYWFLYVWFCRYFDNYWDMLHSVALVCGKAILNIWLPVNK